MTKRMRSPHPSPHPSPLLPRKRRAQRTNTPANTKGFSDKDQRLPPSPPLDNLSRHQSGLMAAVRDKYRNALHILFGSNLTVLNTTCLYFDPQQQHQQSKTSKRRRLQPPLPTNDQVVPGPEHASPEPSPEPSIEPSSAPSTPPPSLPTQKCSSPQSCKCATSLWNADGIGPELMLRAAEELSDRIITLYSKCISPESQDVDYSSLIHSSDFHNYLASARKLRYFDPLLLNPTERKAFFLNVYNSLMIHAIAVMSKPQNMFDRTSLYNTAAYDIGGRHYSLNMIEHGVLRANRPGAGPFAQPHFSPTDPRRQCSLPKVDPRIHFALNCGARSCPAVRFYEARNLDSTLDSATNIYLSDVSVDFNTNTITLPKLLQWYKQDFCEDGDIGTAIKWMLPFLGEEMKSHIRTILRSDSFKVVFAEYDWTVNDSSVVD